MGEDKYAVSFKQKELINYPLKLAKQLNANEVLVVGNNSQSLEGDFTFLQDELDSVGPLGGIYTGLKQSSNDINVVLPCDTPFMNVTVIMEMIGKVTDHEIVVPSYEGRLHPVSGVYKKGLAERLASFLDAGGRKMMDFVNDQKVRILSEEELSDHADLQTFVNLNTKNDIQKYGS